MRYRNIFILALTSLVIGCSHFRALNVPSSSEISKITVGVDLEYHGKGKEHSINDLTEIKKIMKFISDNNKGWSESWLKFPIHPYYANINTDKTRLTIYLSKDSAGACEVIKKETECYYWSINKSQIHELLLLLQINV